MSFARSHREDCVILITLWVAHIAELENSLDVALGNHLGLWCWLGHILGEVH